MMIWHMHTLSNDDQIKLMNTSSLPQETDEALVTDSKEIL
jgi:hypothetical protein